MQSCVQQSQTLMQAPAMQCRCLMRTPGTSFKSAVHQHSRAVLCIASRKNKNREWRHSQKSHRLQRGMLWPVVGTFLFRYVVSNTLRPSYMQTARRGTIHLLTSINLTTTTNNCICLQKSREQARRQPWKEPSGMLHWGEILCNGIG